MVALIRAIAALLAFAAAPVAVPATGTAGVEVRFVEPERYRDALPRAGGPGIESERERQAVLAELRSHLQQLGDRYLRAGDRLTLEILDLDLAGEVEFPRGGAQERRVLRSDTAPRITLRLVLERGGERSEATERITDPGYQLRTGDCRRGETLCYEKRMLSDWFGKRFGRGGQ